MIQRIEQLGFMSEYKYSPNPGRENAVLYPMIGILLMEKDKSDTIQLFVEHSGLLHNLDEIQFMLSVSSTKEGKKKFPRPYVYENQSDGTIKMLSTGERLKVSYLGGDVHNPLVEGAIEPMAIITQHKFLRFDPQNLDRQPERYENDNYVYEFENNGEGGINLTIEAKKKDDQKKNKGGTANISITLKGQEEVGGTLSLNLTGSVQLNQIDKDGNPVQTIIMDGTKDAEKISLKDKNENVVEMSKDKISVTGKKDIEITVEGDAKITAFGDATIDATQICLNGQAGKVLTDVTATPACLFSGKPFPGVLTVKAG